MCGGAIISDLRLPAKRSLRRLTADLLWGTDLENLPAAKDNGKRSKAVIDLEDDFEADFQGFKDDSEGELEATVPFASKDLTFKGTQTFYHLFLFPGASFMK